MMGGRAAEKMVMGTATSGAENDLKQATQLARRMVLDWGMSEQLEHLAFGDHHTQVFLGEQIAQGRNYSESTAYQIDLEIKSILEHAYEQASQVIQENREPLDQLADDLLEHEEIPGEDVLSLIKKTKESAIP